MKTRQELILDFMMQLASNPAMIDEDYSYELLSSEIESLAECLTDQYLSRL
jgi:hypothetical protein